ncbi:uracil phosphoribosyltransferase [Mycoplasma sp. Ms02]|uniref:uracil phosphoribosyltransferase n=1 Tax=Mycoplasma sp. Ms02 TaxID=353851 RepID=UPI001C89A6D9|nr:uracil phosphoribosyltransferase [Mycoplasma sp. Ms02]QZE12466.1 uracil phosphoribosyltransferase [Mycoplasma sp. Ms02]
MLKIINHPLIEIKLTNMRDKSADHSVFRRNLSEIGSLMIYEILRNYQTKEKVITTPLNIEYKGKTFDKEVVFVPILRAGLGMLDGLLNLVSEARVGHVGIYRDEKTHKAVEYFYKMPEVPLDSELIVVDPMLASGASAIEAIKMLQKRGFKNIKLCCLVGVKEGVRAVEQEFGNDFEIFLASLDEKLNDKKYIEPGLGDAGDRIFGTK